MGAKAVVVKELSRLFNKSKLKEQIKEAGLRMSAAALEAFEALVLRAIREAGQRATANGRSTIQAHDVLPGVVKE